jgi:hypothetical protein
MRTALIPFFCLLLGACSFMSDLPPAEVGAQPDQVQLKVGITSGINDSHFAKPIEVTDLIRAPPNSLEPWMLCIRSATSDQAKRPTYSVFYGRQVANGLEGQYIKSRNSAYLDNCAAQEYHSYQ